MSVVLSDWEKNVHMCVAVCAVVCVAVRVAVCVVVHIARIFL